jgi:SAM-dependent methyltransferase
MAVLASLPQGFIHRVGKMSRHPKLLYQRFQTRLFRSQAFARVFVATMGQLARPIYNWAFNLMADDLSGVTRICDVGCGNGLMSARVAESLNGRDFTLIDQSSAQLEAGRYVIQDIAKRNMVRSFAQPVECLPLADESVDLLYTTGSVNLWTDPVRGLQQCQRVLIPGSTLWLFDQAPCVSVDLVVDALFVQRIFGLGMPGYTAQEVLEFGYQAGLRGGILYPNKSLYGIRWTV